jgi:AraC-like DNA-binding protein
MSAQTARTFARHTHDQFGIGVVDDGVHASSSDSRQVRAEPGNLIFVNPGEVHDGRAVDGQSRRWRMLYLEPALLQAMQADIRDRPCAAMSFNAPVFADARLRRLFDAAFAHALATPPCDATMASETALLRVVAGLRVNSTDSARTVPVSSSGCIRRLRERIDDDPAAPLTLIGLAHEAGLSRYQLLRAFARETGLPPHAYILQRRLALARRLLRSGYPLVDSAAAAGFYDQSHLTRCFVRQFGLTPRRYAKAC